MTSRLRVRDIAKSFDGVRAVNGFDLDVLDGEIVSLLGASGCGKTTALRLIAGLERPDRGSIEIRGRTVADAGTWLAPERRRVGLVFQEWALFPHLDVRRNIGFGLDEGADARVDELVDLMRLHGLEERLPHELSGGQQQRVAVARALAPRPDILLLDEPFSNLDAQLRASVRAEVRDALRATGMTAVLVTHDQDEALSVADKVAVMVEGRVRQVGTPFAVYASPADGSVARLLGQANVLPGRAVDGVVEFPLGSIRDARVPDGPCDVLVRPESLHVEVDPGGTAEVANVEFYGHDQLVRCVLPDGRTVDVRLLRPRSDLAPGRRVRLEVAGDVLALAAGTAR